MTRLLLALWLLFAGIANGAAITAGEIRMSGTNGNPGSGTYQLAGSGFSAHGAIYTAPWHLDSRAVRYGSWVSAGGRAAQAGLELGSASFWVEGRYVRVVDLVVTGWVFVQRDAARGTFNFAATACEIPVHYQYPGDCEGGSQQRRVELTGSGVVNVVVIPFPSNSEAFYFGEAVYTFTPEGSSLGLVGAGLVVLLLVRRRVIRA